MRRKDREITDIETLRAILDSAKVMHLGMVDTGRPYVVPLNYGYTLSEEGGLCLYFHSALAGRKLEILKEDPSVFCEISVEHGLNGEGSDACVYSYKYASIMGPGRASMLTSAEDKKAALDIIMRCQTGRGGFTYTMDLGKLAVFKVSMSAYSAKMNLPKA